MCRWSEVRDKYRKKQAFSESKFTKYLHLETNTQTNRERKKNGRHEKEFVYNLNPSSIEHEHISQQPVA